MWKVHRKFFGVDHVAFSYDHLQNLVDTYRRLANAGIDPVWCINHGPTTSLYYEDPRRQPHLQVDNFATNEDLLDWLGSGEFDDNPIGVEFNPNLKRLLVAGTRWPASWDELPPTGAGPAPGCARCAGRLCERRNGMKLATFNAGAEQTHAVSSSTTRWPTSAPSRTDRHPLWHC